MTTYMYKSWLAVQRSATNQNPLFVGQFIRCIRLASGFVNPIQSQFFRIDLIQIPNFLQKRQQKSFLFGQNGFLISSEVYLFPESSGFDSFF